MECKVLMLAVYIDNFPEDKTKVDKIVKVTQYTLLPFKIDIIRNGNNDHTLLFIYVT